MPAGYILDSGVLQGLTKEATAGTGPIHEGLPRGRLVTISEVLAECIDVPSAVLDRLGVRVEASRRPDDFERVLDAFSEGARDVWWRADPLPRADKAIVAHAIAGQLDIVTTDRRMHEHSFREFLRRLDRLPTQRLPGWYLPDIRVVRHLVH